MTNEYFSDVETWRIPETVIADSLTEMAIDGRRGNEGIVLWLGRGEDNVAEVTHLIRLRGPLVEKRPDFINIHPSLLNDVIDVAIERNARIIGQVHSHGPGYSLDLSPTDREYGIKAPSYLSLVAPAYAKTAAAPHSWGVHVCADGTKYIRLTPDEARRRLQLVPGAHLSFLTVGAQ
jgi:proteasome lid subunit RPN8/RPN11